jgi:hypothetical protein
MLAVAVPQPLAAGGAGAGRLADGAAVTLVGPERTEAQLALQLCMSVRTVCSHLDQIRDKTGCRLCAGLTRLALSAGLVELSLGLAHPCPDAPCLVGQPLAMRRYG